MSRNLIALFWVAIWFASPVWSADRPNLTGTWELKTGASELPSSRGASLRWIIAHDDPKIHISEIARYPDGKEKKTDIVCTTDGKECEIKGKNQPTKVSFWYNGPMLVEMDFTGRNRDTVTKKRMRLADGGAQMTVELIPLVGGEDPGRLVFQKQ